MSLVVFRLKLLATWKIHDVFHASLLLPYKEMEEHGPNFEEPPPDLINGEHKYKVEQVLDVRLHGQWKKCQYLIRWKGYSEAHNSWEPEDNVHAPDRLADFTQNHLKKAHDVGIKAAAINDEPIIIRSISISPPTTTLTMSTPPISQLTGEDQ
jgi:Chromo (CHRromatin Organisation MOdifier) domain